MKGLDSYKEFIKNVVDSNRKILTSEGLKVFLYKPFIKVSKVFTSEVQWIERICAYFDFKLKSTVIQEGVRQTFPYIVEYKGNEYYLVDLIDSDLRKFESIETYYKSQSSRYWKKKEVIAIGLEINTLVMDKLVALQEKGLKLEVLSPNNFQELLVYCN